MNLSISDQNCKNHRVVPKYQESKAIQAIKSNTKYFYSYAKTNSKIKPRVGPLYDKKKKIFTDSSKEMADLLKCVI